MLQTILTSNVHFQPGTRRVSMPTSTDKLQRTVFPESRRTRSSSGSMLDPLISLDFLSQTVTEDSHCLCSPSD